MKRLFAALLFTSIVGGSLPGWAQNTDPLTIGQGQAPGALEGSYITGGEHLQFLALSAPRGATQAHLQFYSATCTVVDNRIVDLTDNDVELLGLTDPLVTRNRVGNVLVTASPGDAPIIGWTYYVDVSRGIARLEEMSRLSAEGGTGWAPYKPAHALLFAPPDNGVSTFVTLLVRCPTGTATQAPGAAGGTVVGTPGTLGGDMLDRAAVSDGAAPGSVFGPGTTTASDGTLCSACDTNGVFASALFGLVFDDDENFLGSLDNLSCRCLGLSSAGGTFVNEPRLRDISPAAAQNGTYWELFGAGGSLFTASVNLQLRAVGLNVNFFSRLHNARAVDNLE